MTSARRFVMPWPQRPPGFTRPCCGAHADDFDRATGSVHLPHSEDCRYAH